MCRLAALCLAAIVFSGILGLAVSGAAARPTEDDVNKAIYRAMKYLIDRQQADGLWPEPAAPNAPLAGGQSELAFYTLAELGEHPNEPHMQKALEAILLRKPETTTTVSLHAMGLAVMSTKVIGDRRATIRSTLAADVQWLLKAQGGGSWDSHPLNHLKGPSNADDTAIALQALSLAERYDTEVPQTVWRDGRAYFVAAQLPDGGWNRAGSLDRPTCGSTTAAALASLGITMDHLTRGSPCPFSDTAAAAAAYLTRPSDLAAAWLGRQFKVDAAPGAPAAIAHKNYWLYQAKRAALAWGIKRYGKRDWYVEGVEHLLKTQAADGSWGDIEGTCYAVLFLHNGRRPPAFSKLRFAGEWNAYPRDLGNALTYAGRWLCFDMMDWWVVGLNEPLAGLHDTPVLYVSLGSIPPLTEADIRKLRAYTDTGGTIFLAPPSRNEQVAKWIPEFVRKVWPEWPLKPLPPEHAVFTAFGFAPKPMGILRSIQGIDDGLRTFVFVCSEDVACRWQDRDIIGDGRLFDWTWSLLCYANDRRPLRGRLPGEKAKPRYTAPVKPGPRTALKVARLKYDGGDWTIGRQYRGFDRIVAAVKERAGITLAVDEAGVAAAAMAGHDAAYLAASAGMAMSRADREALRKYLAAGGFLWIEAVGGSVEADLAVGELASDVGWELRPLPPADPLLCGMMPRVGGYNLTTNVAFSRSLRVERLVKPYAELSGIFQDGRLVGLYSPFDVVFSTADTPAFGCRGYLPEDAEAVATNILLHFSCK